MPPEPRDAPLTPAERERLSALRETETLAALADLLGTTDEDDAYFEAKEEWRALRGRELAAEPLDDGLPGARVVVDGTAFHVHGVTHADTAAERAFVRRHVQRLLADGAAVCCEQGVRPMYFDDFDAVHEMDDYRWAMARWDDLDASSPVDWLPGSEVSELLEDVSSLASQLRKGAFALVEDNADVYGEAVAAALGEAVSAFFASPETVATGTDYESFAASKAAAEDPTRLGDLQRYYERAFLPQPLEREWLRRHDPELEIVTHARNERMADHAVYHADGADAVHLVVGAAHQPGVRYYLERYRAGVRDGSEFEPVA